MCFKQWTQSNWLQSIIMPARSRSLMPIPYTINSSPGYIPVFCPTVASFSPKYHWLVSSPSFLLSLGPKESLVWVIFLPVPPPHHRWCTSIVGFLMHSKCEIPIMSTLPLHHWFPFSFCPRSVDHAYSAWKVCTFHLLGRQSCHLSPLLCVTGTGVNVVFTSYSLGHFFTGGSFRWAPRCNFSPWDSFFILLAWWEYL